MRCKDYFQKAVIELLKEGEVIDFHISLTREFYDSIKNVDDVENVGLAFLREIERAINRKNLDVGQQ